MVGIKIQSLKEEGLAKQLSGAAMPRGRGQEALDTWAKRRLDAVRQRCGNRWYKKFQMIELGIFLDIEECGEWVKWMTANCIDRFEQRGSNGATEVRLLSKAELAERADAEFERERRAFAERHPTVASASSAAPPLQPVVAVMAAAAPPTPPVPVAPPADSPAAGVQYTDLADRRAVQVLILSIVFQQVKFGWMTTAALRVALQSEPGWTEANAIGIGRMLGAIRDRTNFLESREEGSMRDYRVTHKGASTVLGLTEDQLEELGSVPTAAEELEKARDELANLNEWHYNQVIRRIAAELSGFPPEEREDILALVREQLG